MPYTAPLNDYAFIFKHIVPIAPLLEGQNDLQAEDINAILREAAKLCDTTLTPLQRVGDLNPAILQNGAVVTAKGFADGYHAIAGGGWVGISADPKHGGMGVPLMVGSAVHDMMAGACIALHLCPLLSQGQIEALEHHASDALKALYLPKLNSGEWTGTMNLTEPQAGSDVGALSCKAQRQADGTYLIEGQKIYITWGEHDMAENICHLVLARLPDGGAGVKGISLFLVPKFLPNADGSLGAHNAMRCVSLEHKLGIHGSPTAVMEYAGATGWLVGAEHDGMAAMFTMMNNARLAVGLQGVGVAEAAYQHAVQHALERKQGRALCPPEVAHGTIIDHADVRRMLMSMRADIFAARAITTACGFALDMAKTGDGDIWAARAALLTPIAKSFGSDVGVMVADTGVQIYGGMGYVEETAAAQFLRDVRITPIYEGTNGIQAMDLVGRKIADEGAAAFALLDEIIQYAQTARKTGEGLAAPLITAARRLSETTEWMLAQSKMDARFAGAVPYQKAFARVLGGYFHLRAAQSGDAARASLAHFYMNALLPECDALCAQAQIGTKDIYAIPAQEF